MTSASSNSAKMLFEDSKNRLSNRVQANVNNVASLARQIQKGSRTNELLTKVARETVGTENNLDNIEGNLKKMQLISVHMGYQYDCMKNAVPKLENINELAASMQR